MKKKILSLLTAFAMVFGIIAAPFTSASAAEEKTEKITLHKILQTEASLNAKDKEGKNIFPGTKGLNGTEYEGNQITDITGYFGNDAKPIAGVYFAVKNSSGNYIDKSGNELANQDPKQEGFDKQANILGGLTTEDGLVLDVSNITQAKTEYTIEEIVELSTYKSDDGKLLAGKKAVPVKITLPLVNEKGTIKQAHVYPKNTEEMPEIDKNFAKDHGLEVIDDTAKNNNAGADYNNYLNEKATVTAELGKEVPYEVKTKVDAGSRYGTLNWKDTMSNGLTFDTEKGVTIEAKTVVPEGQTSETITLSATGETPDYKLTADDRGFTLSLTEAGLKKINAKTHPETGEGVAVEFTLTYSATVNKNAIVDVPEKNNIKLEYSNNRKEEKTPTPVTPQNGELKVTKTWDGKGKTEEVEVVYTLSNGTDSYAVMLNGKEENNTKYDLGNGVTFEVTGAYAGTFKGEVLKTGNWTIAERVAGYDETIDATTTGTAAITNKKDNENPSPLNPKEPKVVYYGKRFVKADQSTGERLQGAEFVVKNSAGKFLALKDLNTTEGEGKALKEAKDAYDAAVKAWNDAVKAQSDKEDEQITVKIGEEDITGKTAAEKKINELYETYAAAFEKAKNAYTWVDNSTDANVVTLVSDKQGKFEIKGLEKGTYYLVETKAPQGYAKKTEEEEFKVEEGTYAAHENGVTYESDNSVNDDTGAQAQRVNNKLVTIPQTGGIGSVIFIVAGLAIMAGAFVAYKKSQATA